jgi:uncharacterized membrane protein
VPAARRPPGRLLAFLVTACASTWLAMLLAAPWVRAAPDPSPGPRTIAGLAYIAGSRVCHQRPERTLTVAGAPMPVCARCTGLYAGAVAGLVLALVRGRGRGGRTALAIAALPTVLSLAIEWMGGPSGPASRLMAALPLGFVVGTLVVAAAAEFPGGRWTEAG